MDNLKPVFSSPNRRGSLASRKSFIGTSSDLPSNPNTSQNENYLSSPNYSLSSSYKESVYAKKTQELEILMRENKNMRQEIEEKGFTLCDLKNENSQLKEDCFKKSFRIESLENEIKNSLILKENEEPDWWELLSRENKRYADLLGHYQIILQENKKIVVQFDKFLELKENNLTLLNQVESMKKETQNHLKTIFDLKTELRRTPPQESIEFHAELDKIKQVLSAHKEPSIEVRKEIEKLKIDSTDLKFKLKEKEHQIELLESLVVMKDKELNTVKAENDERTKALLRLSTYVVESKEREIQLEEALRIERNLKPSSAFDARFLRGPNEK